MQPTLLQRDPDMLRRLTFLALLLALIAFVLTLIVDPPAA